MAEEENEGEAEEVYNDEGREEMMESDEISPEEDAFMQGYDEDSDEKKKEEKEQKEDEEE